MSKYFYYSGDGAWGLIDSRGCGQYNDAAYVNDTFAHGCWAIHGTRIILGPVYCSYQAGWEQVNAMFKVNATQNPLPTFIALSRLA